MISSLFFKSRTKNGGVPVSPSTPEGVVVWAIGDIHGRLDLLETLTDAILVDAAATVAARKVVVFLGDYVDRGSDSRGVLQYLQALPSSIGIEWRFLMGNHEETMLQFLSDGSVGARWCEYGGDATLRSYGLRIPQLKHRLEPWSQLSADLRHKLNGSELSFLESLETTLTVGSYFFVHAGARPGIALEKQSPSDLLWIRRSFLDSDVGFDRIVVHGHTPSAEVHADQRRIGIDTKAYESGRLTALKLVGQRRWLLQTEAGPDGVEVSIKDAS